MQKYDDMTKGIKNGKPVYVELEVVDMGKADDGFAADYEGVYQIMKINKMALKERTSWPMTSSPFTDKSFLAGVSTAAGIVS